MPSMNHWISLYLSGQYPGHYRLPNRFDVLMKIRETDPTNFNEGMLSLIKDKGDVEFYHTLLSAFESAHWTDGFGKLMDSLGVPPTVRKEPFSSSQSSSNLADLATSAAALKGFNETNFSRYVVMPLLLAQWYEEVEYKGKVNQTDFGTDFCVVRYCSPGGITHYAAVQTKSVKMSEGDTSPPWKELKKLIEEVDTAFNHPHRVNTGEEVYISEMLVLNSKEVSGGARDKFFKNKKIAGKKVKFLAFDWVLSLISELGLNIISA